MKGFDDFFKEYKRGTVGKEFKIIEELLMDEIKWGVDSAESEAYKALERQRNNLLHVEEVI